MLPLLFLLFILLPIAELWLIIEIGGSIGVLPTLALLIVDSLVGAALARSQSRAAWERFNRCPGRGPHPGKEVFDGAMIILGGALLLTPGFITDIFGLILLDPADPRRRPRLPRPAWPGRRGAVAFRVAEFGYAKRPGRGPRPGQSYDYEGVGQRGDRARRPSSARALAEDESVAEGIALEPAPGSGSSGTTWRNPLGPRGRATDPRSGAWRASSAPATPPCECSTAAAGKGSLLLLAARPARGRRRARRGGPRGPRLRLAAS